jgi:hypothetical protein
MPRKTKGPPKPVPFPTNVDGFTQYVFRRYAELRDTDDWQDAMFLLRYICRNSPVVMQSWWFIRETMYLNEKYDLPDCIFLQVDHTSVAMHAAMWKHVAQPLLKAQGERMLEILQWLDKPSLDEAWVQAHIEDAERTLRHWQNVREDDRITGLLRKDGIHAP